jgi:hypothetical protein
MTLLLVFLKTTKMKIISTQATSCKHKTHNLIKAKKNMMREKKGDKPFGCQ